MMTPQIAGLLRAGVDALRAGDLVRAAELSEEGTRLAPTQADCWFVLCSALTRMGSADAERAMGDALRHIPSDHPGRLALEVDRAKALAVRGRSGEAAALALSVRNNPKLTPLQHNVLGSTFSILSLFELSLEHCAIAAKALPDHALVIYNLGTAQRYLGLNDEAEASFRRVLDLEPDHSLAVSSLSSLKKWSATTNNVPAIQAAIGRVQAETEHDARLHFALFKELDDLGRTDEAWAALEKASKVVSQLWPFGRAEKAERVKALIETFSIERLKTGPRAASGRRPRVLCVLGLPRSGTTLTERILAAHSRVTALGENSSLSLAIREGLKLARSKELDSHAFRAAGDLNWDGVADAFLANTRYRYTDADIITEKLPHNYELVGPFSLAFPDAKVVHVRRSPLDSLFGAHRLMFGEAAYLWSYSLEDLAEAYRRYRALMAHWKAALGEQLVEVRLEDLIAEPEPQIRRLLDACGLAFEPACLSPHEAEGGVSTASAAQIRKPINAGGVGAWRRYAAQLEPLRAMLERDGFVDADGNPTD